MVRIALGCVGLAALAACADTGGTVNRAPNAAEQACLLEITRITNNPDLTLLGSEFSEAGTFVRIGVGPQRAPWQCIADSDGSTRDVASLTDEGAL